MKTATCFFCYAWDEENIRFGKLEFLRKRIKEKAGNRVEVILDKHTYEDNADFDVLREKIWQYDLIVVFFTPDYKEIVVDRKAKKNKDREVLKEYDIILERYLKEYNSAFPVIFEGDKESSLPKEFVNRNARIYDSFRITKTDKKRYRVPDVSQTEYNKFLNKIVQTAIHNCADKSEEYKTAEDALEKLFGLTNNVLIPQSCLVIPELYHKIRLQSCMFIAGRKGSGKSTFIKKFKEMDQKYFEEHYKKMMPISAETFNYEIVYELLFAAHTNDKIVVERYTVMCLFWEVYFVLYTMVIIRAEIEDKIITRENDDRYDIFNRVTRKLFRLLGMKVGHGSIDLENTEVIKQIFFTSAEMVDNRYLSALDEIDNDNLILSQFSSKFTLSSIIEKEFTQKELSDFFKGVHKCGHKIMFSLDGFDTHSEDFRITTSHMNPQSEEFKAREEFERLFFRTLLEVATKFKEKEVKDKIGNQIGDVLDFCIVLPKDRYDQIVQDDRDVIKRNFGSLSWSALELQELLTKRLECLITKIDSTYIVDTKGSYEERMNKALSFFPGLPMSIEMHVNGNVMRMPLFNYILRSSFWRPRDVISNLSKIMSQVVTVSGDDWKSNGVCMNEENIKLAIKKNASQIIKKEFIGEYKHVFRNLDDVLERLQGHEEQMHVPEFMNIIKGIPFDASFSYDMNDINNKVRVLYQLGIIGLIYSKGLAKRQHYLNHICFEFNEGMEPLEDFLKMKKIDGGDIQIIFNPLFAGRLMLNYNTNELIGNWSTEYISNNHINKGAIHSL